MKALKLNSEIATVIYPPIKIQGSKYQLVNFIKNNLNFNNDKDIWIEPFMGSGVVGFNVKPKVAIFNDINTYIVDFYNALKNKDITSQAIRKFIISERKELEKDKNEYYLKLRNRFNEKHDVLDFYLLTRLSFNGLMRFNRKGEFNAAFCKEPNKFTDSFIDRLISYIEYIEDCFNSCDWIFKNKSYSDIIKNYQDKEDSFFYCDPPYIGRDTQYFQKWSEEDEIEFNKLLRNVKGKFMVSTWIKDANGKKNEYIDTLWKDFNLIDYSHNYRIHGNSRLKVQEGLIMNY